MKLSFLIFIFITFSLQVSAKDGKHDKDCDVNDKACPQRTATPVQTNVMQGKRSQPYSLEDELYVETGPDLNVSTAYSQGHFQPSSPALNITISDYHSGDDNTTLARRNQCSGNTVSLSRKFNSIFGKIGTNPNSPSGAKAGNVVFATANRFFAVSLNGGETFEPPLNPSVFTGPGFCCNQVVHYIPSIKRFVWLLEYSPNGHHFNNLRLIIFDPKDVDKTGPTSWLYLDIFSTDIGVNRPLVFGDLAVGDHKLWLSATVKDIGLVVIRIPIPPLVRPGLIQYWYTNPADGAVAYRSRLAQNPGDTAFWAGHSVLGTTLRVFKWREDRNTYHWTDIAINPWPANRNDFVAPCPGKPTTSWVDNTLGRIIGATRRYKKEVWFAWAASKGGLFPNVHIQVAQIDPSNWPAISLKKQWPIWNPSFAFAYPAFYTNECHDVGLAVAFGSGPYNPSSAVGIADSDGILQWTVYAPELSDVCHRGFGDYLTVRKGEGKCFGGYVYAGKHGRWRSRYREFGRGP